VCRRYSRAYLHHLYKAKELNLYYLVTLHNLYFYARVMDRIRKAVRESTLGRLVAEWRGLRF
jgi:queuine tRNA-ribosyltransferase